MDADSTSVMIISAAVGMFLTFGVAAIGYAISASNEGKRWQRDQRLTVYKNAARIHAEYNRGLLDLRHYDRRLENLEGENLDEEAHRNMKDKIANKQLLIRDRVNALNTELTGLMAETQIVGTQKAVYFLKAHLSASQKLRSESQARAELREHRNQRDASWEDFINQTQKDLGLKHRRSRRV